MNVTRVTKGSIWRKQMLKMQIAVRIVLLGIVLMHLVRLYVLNAFRAKYLLWVKYHAVIAVSIHFPKIQLLLLVKRAQLDIRL